jgi:hypothetical protein
LVSVLAGVFVGALVGGFKGASVGALVGALVGAFVSALVGALVGTLVGAFVGILVGAIIGKLERDFVGITAGKLVGAVTGIVLGTADCDVAGTSVVVSLLDVTVGVEGVCGKGVMATEPESVAAKAGCSDSIARGKGICKIGIINTGVAVKGVTGIKVVGTIDRDDIGPDLEDGAEKGAKVAGTSGFTFLVGDKTKNVGWMENGLSVFGDNVGVGEMVMSGVGFAVLGVGEIVGSVILMRFTILPVVSYVALSISPQSVSTEFVVALYFV